MKVLIVTGIFPPDIGGPATYVPQVAAALARRGHQITVLTLSDETCSFCPEYTFPVVRLPRWAFKPWRWLRAVAEIIRLGREVDVLFVNGLALEAVLANLLLRKPMVQKVVGDLAWERATNRGWVSDTFEAFQTTHYQLRATRYAILTNVLKALRSWWVRQAHVVITPSRYLADRVLRWGVPQDSIAVIYNAMEPTDGITTASVPLPTPVKAVTVGRLIPLKRVDQILETVARVRGLGLVIIGDGPERLRLEGLAASLGITKRVYFAGTRPREETLGLMVGCHLLVLNSTHEGFPHVVVEAMALGLPVVATAVGGTPEVVKDGETGVLIPAQDGSLGIVLLRLAEDQEQRKRLGDAARRWVSTHFTIDRMVDQTESALLGVAQKATPCERLPLLKA